jgi:hypothetical protein
MRDSHSAQDSACGLLREDACLEARVAFKRPHDLHEMQRRRDITDRYEKAQGHRIALFAGELHRNIIEHVTIDRMQRRQRLARRQSGTPIEFMCASLCS